jgi:hypothetical protein
MHLFIAVVSRRQSRKKQNEKGLEEDDAQLLGDALAVNE